MLSGLFVVQEARAAHLLTFAVFPQTQCPVFFKIIQIMQNNDNVAVLSRVACKGFEETI